jgi:hypothetical protein
MELVNNLQSIVLKTETKPSMVVFDIKSLYPNININLFTDLLTNEPNYQILNELVNILKNQQTVQFDNSTYHQISGIPMGDNSSVEIANLYLHDYLDTRITFLQNRNIILYNRFIDDGFIICYEPQEVIEYIKTLLADIGLELNDDIQISSKIVNFLDIYITIRNDRLYTSLYQKPISNFLYLPFTSSHPRHTLTGWIIGELTRFKRYSTTRNDYDISKHQFYRRLLDRCYPRFILDPIFKKYNFSSTPLKRNNPIPFTSMVLPYGYRDLSTIDRFIQKNKQTFLVSAGVEVRTTWTVPKNLSSILTNPKIDTSVLIDPNFQI